MNARIFRNLSGFAALRNYDGQVVRVVELDPKLYDRDEVGQMFAATFPDGHVWDVFADEVSEKAS